MKIKTPTILATFYKNDKNAVLARVWRNGHSHTRLLGMCIYKTFGGDSLVFQKISKPLDPVIRSLRKESDDIQ